MVGKLRGIAALGAALVLCLPGAGGADASARRHAKSMTVVASPRTAVPRETVRVTGSLPGGARSVQLQKLSSGHWRKVTSTRATSRGRFALAFRATAARATYRTYAPKFRTDPARQSRSFVVTTVRPTASLSLAAAPVAQSSSGTQNLTPGVATFRPARPGRPAAVQKYAGGRWTTVASGKQGSSGTFAFKVAAKTSAGTLVAFRAVTSPAAGAASVASGAARSAGYPQVWSDEFSTFDATKWSHRNVGLRFGHRMCADVQPANTVVSNGVAVLKMAKSGPATSACPRGQFSNAEISTVKSRTFTHGIFAARIKYQRARGLHGGFWLQGTAPADGRPNQPARNGAEIDVSEYFGDGRPRGGLSSYVHWWAGTDSKGNATYRSVPESGLGEYNANGRLLPAGRNWSDGYHVVSVEWTPTRYVFRVDGTTVLTTTAAVSQAPEYLVLTLTSSDWELPALNTSQPVTMAVDWVRVWQA